MLTVITRGVSPSINNCELSLHTREPIDVTKAIAQHAAYQECLVELGAKVVALPAEPDLPDSVFVEDAALVFDEVAIITNMGAPSRRPETKTVAAALARYRTLAYLTEPAALDGGDVLCLGRKIFVGLSRRTNRVAIKQLSALLGKYGYEVRPVEMRDCLHLKSACSRLGDRTILLNRAFIEPESFRGFELLDVAEGEPGAANVLLLNNTVIMPVSFPKTRALLEERGFHVQTIDVSELQKAEAGVTCCSLIL